MDGCKTSLILIVSILLKMAENDLILVTTAGERNNAHVNA